MSSKNPRESPVPSTASKLPKFLQKQSSSRDRSKTIPDPSAASASGSSTSSDVASSKSRKSKFLPIRDKDKSDDKARRSTEAPLPPLPPQPLQEPEPVRIDEAPVVVEPVPVPRPRTRSERPLSSALTEPSSHSQHLSPMYSSTSSSRIGDLPTRLSGWFSHTFSASSTDLSLPSLLTQSHSSSASSPRTKGSASALLMAAKHGKGHLDKAMRYILDSDSTPDKCMDPIWLMGVQHPGYEPPPPPPSLSASTSSVRSLRSSASSLSTSDVQSPSSSKQQKDPSALWPPVFYADFTSRVWLTYRSQFTPIRDGRLTDLLGDTSTSEVTSSPTTVRSKPWNWVGGEKGWTSDSGWGCMLRTGQSLLANALIHLHLGRDWRRPPQPIHTVDYATYVQILTWFFDTPSPEAPFSVHRMALAGKELGKDVGQWFGPSTAAGAVKTLVNNFPEAGLGVAVATDGVLFQTEVFMASHHSASSVRSPRRHKKASSSTWGDRPVLLLIGVRLGLDGVNPIYYETVKLLYTFPQSVGIAGGRPSSSYYFVGAQADNLFYLDPHHSRPAVALHPPPSDIIGQNVPPDSDRENPNQRSSTNQRPPNSPTSTRTSSSTFSYHAPMSPSPLQHEFSNSSSNPGSSSSNFHDPRASRSPPSSLNQQRSRFRSASQSHSRPTSDVMDTRELSGLDFFQEHFVTAYTPTDLKTFHCERVRKMPLSGLDPSMLIGFLCKDETDWWDFRRRVGDLPKTVFSIQDEPPSWPSDSDDNMGFESISEPDDFTMDMEDDEEIVDDANDDNEDDEEEQFYDTRSASASVSSGSAARNGKEVQGQRAKSEEVDTEDDPVDPITPLPNARFSLDMRPEDRAKPSGAASNASDELERYDGGEIEDDWVDPSIPTPTPSETLTPALSSSPTSEPSSPRQTPNARTKKKKKGKREEIPVPVPLVRIPTPGNNRGQQPQQGHFPFPVTQFAPDETTPTPFDYNRSNPSIAENGKRMHTARARDGGRTQSGGVKGILPDD